MALTKIKGQNFRTFVNETVVIEATNCQVTIQGNLEDATTKDSAPSYLFQEQSMVSKQWSVSVDSLDATIADLKTLLQRIKAADTVPVGWDQTGGSANNTAQNAAFARSGLAFLTDVSIQFNNRANISWTCQYTGTGALA